RRRRLRATSSPARSNAIRCSVRTGTDATTAERVVRTRPIATRVSRPSASTATGSVSSSQERLRIKGVRGRDGRAVESTWARRLGYPGQSSRPLPGEPTRSQHRYGGASHAVPPRPHVRLPADPPMFLGHYGVAFAARRAAPRTSLGTTILAAQFLDELWPILLLL